MAKTHKRFSVKAWGSPVDPDLDYETDKLPANLTHPCVCIALLDVVSLESIREALGTIGKTNE